MTSMTGLHRRRMLALALGHALATPTHADPTVPLFVGTAPPSDGTPQMLAWIAARAGLTWDRRPTPWLRAQKLTAEGEGVMFGLARTPQREKELQFSLPVWSNHTWAVVREGDPLRIRRYADLNGQVVCWARGSSYGELFTLAGLGRMEPREAGDDDGALRMAGAGRCRAALITLETADPRQALRHPALAELRERGLALVPVPLATTPLPFVTGHGSRWSWVIDRINQVLSRSRGELQKLRGSAPR
jgi:ABC-type amino acid transport substrate-binding protein